MRKQVWRYYMAGMALTGLVACSQPRQAGPCEYLFEAQPVDLKIDSVADGYAVEGFSAFQVPGHFTWGASVTKAEDGKYLLYFKGNVYDPHWRGVHGVALSDSPTGPFVPLDEPVFHIEGASGKLSAEDPYVWYHEEDECFYAIFKDFNGQFTKGEPCLAIMASVDGIHWTLPEHSLFMKKQLTLPDGTVVKVKRLERPQLLLDEKGNPEVLYAACAIDEVNPKVNGGSFNVQIKIKPEKIK